VHRRPAGGCLGGAVVVLCIMSYELSFTEKPTYLHVVVRGQNSRETVAHYMEEVLRECSTRHCMRVLIEERLEGPRLGTIDVFTLASAGTLRHMGALKSMAYVDLNAEGDTMRFAETVATNRAFPVKVFSTVAAAERWLLGELQPSGEADAAEAK
jgi:hypothetical protein